MSERATFSALALLPGIAVAQNAPDYREAVKQAVRSSMKNPDKISFEWGADPVEGWTAMKGKPKASGLLGCVAVLGKNTGGGAYEDRTYLVFVFDRTTSKVSGQVFSLNQLNKALTRYMGTWFSRDPGCPSGQR